MSKKIIVNGKEYSYKTGLMLRLAMGLTKEKGAKVLFITPEESVQALVRRVCEMTGFEYPEEFPKVIEHLSTGNGALRYHNINGNCDVKDIQEIVEQDIPDYVVVDNIWHFGPLHSPDMVQGIFDMLADKNIPTIASQQKSLWCKQEGDINWDIDRKVGDPTVTVKDEKGAAVATFDKSGKDFVVPLIELIDEA